MLAAHAQIKKPPTPRGIKWVWLFLGLVAMLSLLNYMVTQSQDSPLLLSTPRSDSFNRKQQQQQQQQQLLLLLLHRRHPDHENIMVPTF